MPKDSRGRERGLLCVNHEYTNANLMFPGLATSDDLAAMTREQVEVEMAAMGHSVVTIVRNASGLWRVDRSSPLNRRLTAWRTAVQISGPAAGHSRAGPAPARRRSATQNGNSKAIHQKPALVFYPRLPGM